MLRVAVTPITPGKSDISVIPCSVLSKEALEGKSQPIYKNGKYQNPWNSVLDRDNVEGGQVSTTSLQNGLVLKTFIVHV